MPSLCKDNQLGAMRSMQHGCGTVEQEAVCQLVYADDGAVRGKVVADTATFAH